MDRFLILALSITGTCSSMLVGCSTNQPVSEVNREPSPPRVGQVDFVPIADGVWIHTTYMSLPEWGLFPSNGMIVRGNMGCVIIDTGCSDDDMTQIYNWANEHAGEVLAVIVTHAHEDSMGGIGAAHERSITTVSSTITQQIAMEEGLTPPLIGFSSTLDLHTYSINGECYFPGAGHSTDNIVVWIENSKVLFGGCFIRPLSSNSLGNISDADLDAWPSSVQRVIDRYEDIAIVVPGHFHHGDDSMLCHTIELHGAQCTP